MPSSGRGTLSPARGTGTTATRPPIRIEPLEGYRNVRGPLEEAGVSEDRSFWRTVLVLVALGVMATLAGIAILFG